MTTLTTRVTLTIALTIASVSATDQSANAAGYNNYYSKPKYNSNYSGYSHQRQYKTNYSPRNSYVQPSYNYNPFQGFTQPQGYCGTQPGVSTPPFQQPPVQQPPFVFPPFQNPPVQQPPVQQPPVQQPPIGLPPIQQPPVQQPPVQQPPVQNPPVQNVGLPQNIQGMWFERSPENNRFVYILRANSYDMFEVNPATGQVNIGSDGQPIQLINEPLSFVNGQLILSPGPDQEGPFQFINNTLQSFAPEANGSLRQIVRTPPI